jgi:hypothetical protein
MDRFPPAEDGPRYEMQSIGRTLDDLEPAEEVEARAGGVGRPLAWVALAVFALIAFVCWLLVGPPWPR